MLLKYNINKILQFDNELLKSLKKTNKNNIGKISLPELIEVFKLWS